MPCSYFTLAYVHSVARADGGLTSTDYSASLTSSQRPPLIAVSLATFSLTLLGSQCEPAHIGGATNARDFALSYGGGVGVKIGSPPGWFDLSIRYLNGGEADYLRKGALRREGGQVALDITRSRTDMVMIYLGVAFGR